MNENMVTTRMFAKNTNALETLIQRIILGIPGNENVTKFFYVILIHKLGLRKINL